MNQTDADNKIITRFPPSPTGKFHVGSARTALFNYLFTRKHKQGTGDISTQMVMRFEDTDQERSEKKFEEDIKEGLEWLGIEYEGPFWQSERTDIYKRYLKKMVEDDHAYISEEEGGNGKGRREVIRFRNPDKIIEFEDRVRGTVSVDTSDLGDFVLAKSFTEPLYHLAVVIDDLEMGVTHVIRGEDHISNTPRQILIQEAVDAPRPVYAHMPMINGPDGKKLSKRHGATSLTQYKEDGFLAEAMINYLSLLGWHPKDDEEILSLNEITERFSLDELQKSPAVFSREKLEWVNRQYIINMEEDEFLPLVEDWIPAGIKKLPNYSHEMLQRVVPIIKERTDVLKDIIHMAESGDLEYYFSEPEYWAKDLLWKDDTPKNTQEYLTVALKTLSELPEGEFDKDKIKSAVWDYASEKGRGNVLWPLRYALCGVERSPDPFELSKVLGKDKTLLRIEKAIDKLKDLEESKEQSDK